MRATTEVWEDNEFLLVVVLLGAKARTQQQQQPPPIEPCSLVVALTFCVRAGL